MGPFAKSISLGLACSLTLSCTPSKVSEHSSAKSYCEMSQAKVVATYTPKFIPKYFFKPVGDQNEIAFVGYDFAQGKDKNYLVDLKSGVSTAIPGRLDPIGLFAKDLVTIPLDLTSESMKMAFYDLRELRKKGLATRPLFEDATLNGRYQSLALLKNAGSLATFRVFTDGHDGGEFRDYEVNFASIPAKLKPLAEAKSICPEYRSKDGILKLKLPMISKDGALFSAFDLEAQEMRLFKLNSLTGACTPLRQKALGQGDIGKLDFSPDRSQVAFHYSDRDLTFTDLTFGQPGHLWHLRGAVYDFNAQTYQLLPFAGQGSNTYYPAFMPNGHVMFLQMKGDGFEYVEVDLSQARSIPATQIDSIKKLNSDDFAAYQFISQTWMAECTSTQTASMRFNRLLSVLSLSKDQCLELISKPGVAGTQSIKTRAEAVCRTLH